MKRIKQLLLLLCLLTAVAPSVMAQSWLDYENNPTWFVYKKTVGPVNGIYYYLYEEMGHYWVGDLTLGYFASVCNIETNATELTVPETITYDGLDWKVSAVGYWFDQRKPEKVEVYQNKTPNLTTLRFAGNISICSKFSLGMPTKLVFEKKLSIVDGEEVEFPGANGTLELYNATEISIGGAFKLTGTLLCNPLTELRLDKGCPQFGEHGFMDCLNLQKIYFGSSSNLPFWMGSYSDHFSQYTHPVAYLYEATDNDIHKYKTQYVVWSGFADVRAWTDKVNVKVTKDEKVKAKYLSSDGTALMEMNYSQSQSKETKVKEHNTYTLRIEPETTNKRVELLRNGVVKTQDLETLERVETTLYGTYTYTYYEYTEEDLTSDVNYQIHMYDKRCLVTILQPGGHRQNVTCTYQNNGKSFTKSSSNYSFFVDPAYGSTMTLQIPYDEYIPSVIQFSSQTDDIIPTMKDGVATAKVNIGSNFSEAELTIVWEKPAPPEVPVDPDDPTPPTPQKPHRAPKVMVMRSGEGEVMMRGLFVSDEQHTIDYYDEATQSATDMGSWHVSKQVNCVQPITTVTVPDTTVLGDTFDEGGWAFRLLITPQKGLTLKTLMLGVMRTDDEDNPYVEWEDMLDDPDYDEATNTYNFLYGNDYMSGYGPTDCIVNLAMGPEEETVNAAKLSFVRTGGKSLVRFNMEDPEHTIYNDTIPEGGTSYRLSYYTQQEEDETGMESVQWLDFIPVAGETIRVLCDNEDVTDHLNWQQNGTAYINLERATHTYSILIDEAPDARSTWTILQGEDMTGTQMVTTFTGGSSSTENLTAQAQQFVIDADGVEKVTLRVPNGQRIPASFNYVVFAQVDVKTQNKDILTQIANALTQTVPNMTLNQAKILLSKGGGALVTRNTRSSAESLMQALNTAIANNDVLSNTTYVEFTLFVREGVASWNTVANAKPVRVLRNGADFTAQMDFSNALYATYEVPAMLLTNETWEIGFDNSHRQTFVRNGGSRESSINYETWGGDASIDISSGEVTTVLLPPYDDSQCSTVRLAINVSDDELLTVTRNGVDVTEQFDYDEEDGYRTYFFQSSIDDAQSVDTWGYSLRDPATWVINIRQSRETSIGQTFVKPESVGISLIHSYFNGQSPVEAQLTQEFNPVFFDDNDRLIYSSVELKVRTDRTQPVRVLRNGVDITFSQQLISTEEEDGDIILGYNVPLTEAATWDISYDNSHRQNVYVRGGTGLPNGDVGEWNFENVYADAFKYFKPNELVVVDLPPYNSEFNTYMTLSFFVKDNETFTAIRNGVNVTGSFASRALSTSGFRLYELDENNGEFSFDMREPATWIITIDDGSGQYDVNRDGSINVTDVTKLVDKILHP